MRKRRGLVVVVVLLLLLLLVGGVWFVRRDRGGTSVATAPAGDRARPGDAAAGDAAIAAAIPDPRPGQGRVVAEPADLPGGAINGRVINWSTGEGVAGAELTFTSNAGASTIRTGADGAFELAPPAPGMFVLAAIASPGFLPYAPELAHSTVHVALARGQRVRGVQIFLFPALDYRGTVADAHRVPVAGAHVRLLGTPAGEQAIDKLATEWTTDRDGHFTFHAADDAVLEAVHGKARGWARLDGAVAITHQLEIMITEAPARDLTITGHTIDASGAPIADALIRAEPSGTGTNTLATAFATSGADGAFTLTGLDRAAYDLAADAEDHAPVTIAAVAGGSRDVTLTLEAGLPLAGHVVDPGGAPVPAFTLLVFHRDGAARSLVVARSIVDPRGAFVVRVPRGDYELTASAAGWAPGPPTLATAGTTAIELAVSAGATLRGTVVAAEDGHPLAYARVTREGHGGGASAQPANAGTVTRPDGTFELTGIPPGALAITIDAGGYHPRIEAAMTATDGASLGPLTIALTQLAPGEQPTLELVGIGVALSPDGDALRVDRVIAGSGAEAAGIVIGDHVIAVDGAPVAPLGVAGAVAKIRGAAGTTVAISLLRGDQRFDLTVERRKLHA